MTSDEEMEGYARECVRLAHIADDPLIRERLFTNGPRMDGRRHA